MVALFLFLKGMTGALAPFSYLVLDKGGVRDGKSNIALAQGNLMHRSLIPLPIIYLD